MKLEYDFAQHFFFFFQNQKVNPSKSYSTLERSEIVYRFIKIGPSENCNLNAKYSIISNPRNDE